MWLRLDFTDFKWVLKSLLETVIIEWPVMDADKIAARTANMTDTIPTHTVISWSLPINAFHSTETNPFAPTKDPR